MSRTIALELPTRAPTDENNMSEIITRQSAAPANTESPSIEPQGSSQVAEDESHYPTGARFWLIMLSVSLTLILAGMDSSIVSIAVPAITDHFHTVRDVGWYASVYRLGMCSLQFTFGKLYKLFGLKRVFLVSVLVFMTGSFLCAIAPTSATFIVGRAVCGCAGSGLLAGAFAASVETLPLRKRPLWLSILNTAEGISVVIAPLVGGLILSRLSWRWCFWINLTIGIITAVTLFATLPRDGVIESLGWKQRLAELDLLGTITFVTATCLFFIALDWAGTRYPWDSPIVLSLLIASAVLTLVFAYLQHRRQDAGTLPPRILRMRTIIAGFVYSICCNSALQVVQYYLPSYLQAVRNKTALQSSVLMLPIILGSIIGALVQGSGTTLVGYYVPFMLAGSVTMPIFAGLMTTVKFDSNLVNLGLYSGFLGFACSIGYQAPTIAVQTVLPAEDANIGIGIIIFAQQFGPAVFVAAAQNVFSSRLEDNLKSSAISINSTSLENSGLNSLTKSVPPGQLDLVYQGLDQSLAQTWYIAVALACVSMLGSLGMEWRHIRVKND